MDYESLDKMDVQKLRHYLKMHDSKCTTHKNSSEVKSDLIPEYKHKLKIDDVPIPDPFKIPHGWMKKVKE